VVIARRKGDVWYIGGVNGQDIRGSAGFNVAFLGGGHWRGALIKDGASDREFEVAVADIVDVPPGRAGSFGVPMRPRGGFVMRLERAQ